MKSVAKWVMSFVFSAGMYLAGYSQTKDSITAPAEDAIICRQVSENVFDCYVEEGTPDTEMYYNDREENIQPQNKDRSKNNQNKSRDNSEEEFDWNRSDSKADSLKNSKDVYNNKNGNTPGRIDNSDNVHINRDQKQYDKIDEYNQYKERELKQKDEETNPAKEEREIRASI